MLALNDAFLKYFYGGNSNTMGIYTLCESDLLRLYSQFFGGIYVEPYEWLL